MTAACAFPSLRGSQVLVRELAEALASRGHQVHLVTYPYGESLAPLGGILLHTPRLRWRRTRRRHFLGSPAPLGWRKVVLDLRLALVLYRVVRWHRIHVIHAHNYEGLLIGYLIRLLTGVPVVYHSHNALSDELGYYCRRRWPRFAAGCLGRILDLLVPRRADFSIALTPELGSFLRARGVEDSRLAIIPPGRAPLAAPSHSDAQPDSFDGRFVVMYTGNLDAYQDLDVLAEGFAAFRAEVDQALLVLVTHESNWAGRIDGALKVQLQDGDARIVVAQAFAPVRRLMARADVLVCPRSSWSGFPIKLINYMGAGRPLVAAEGSAKGVREGENGLVFPNRDTQALGLALLRLFSDPALRRRLAENARATANAGYDSNRMVSQVEAVYAAVRGDRRDSAPMRVGEPTRPRGLLAFSRDRISAASKRDRG